MTYTVTFAARTLEAAMTRLARTTARKTTLPVLTHVAIRTDGTERAHLTTTNLDGYLTETVPTFAPTETAFTVNVAALLKILKCLPDGEVSLEYHPSEKASGGDVTLRAGTLTAPLQAWPIEDFPLTPEMGAGGSFTIPSALLARMLGETIAAASEDPTSPSLCGVYLHSKDGELRLAATDGHRLAIASHRFMQVEPWKPECIIPLEAAKTLRTLCLEHKRSTLQVEVGEKHVRIVDGWDYIIRLVEGPFPNYEQVIPKDAPPSATLRIADLDGALHTLMPLTNGINYGVVLEDDQEAQAMLITTQAADHPASIRIPLDRHRCYERTGVDAKLLRDALKTMPGTRVRLTLTSPLTVMLIEPAEGCDEGNALLHLLMPLRLNT